MKQVKKGVVILCRYNSSRLYGKVLKSIGNKVVLQHIIDQVKSVTPHYTVATSKEASDLPIANYCKDNNIPCFRGDLDNVSKRFLEAAQSLELDYAIRINGDNFFVNTEVLRHFVTSTHTDYDFCSNVKGRTFPYGMSVEMVRTSFYKTYMPTFAESEIEHVTLHFYNNEAIGKRYYVYNEKYPKASGLKLAIDTQEDFDRTTFIHQACGGNIASLSMEDLLKIYDKYETD